ncbi:MAG: hypothetical protein ACQESD_01250 [Thermoplasmatota archaeon]
MSEECCEPGHGRKGQGHHGRGHHKKGHGKRCGCGCGGHHGWRKYRTKEEVLDELESYKEELQKELEAVEEKIEHIKSH